MLVHPRMLIQLWFVLLGLLMLPGSQANLPSPAPLPPPPPPPNSKPLPQPMPVSKRIFNLGGLVVNVYGLDLLAPEVNGTKPDISVLIHMHGRSHSALDEEPLVQILFGNVRQHMTDDPARSKNDFLLATFDAPDHGNRTTMKQEQDDYSTGNKQFGYVFWLT